MIRLGLAVSIAFALLLAVILGVEVGAAIEAGRQPSGVGIVFTIILLGLELQCAWTWVGRIVAEAVAKEQETEHAWSAVAERIRTGGGA